MKQFRENQRTMFYKFTKHPAIGKKKILHYQNEKERLLLKIIGGRSNIP